MKKTQRRLTPEEKGYGYVKVWRMLKKVGVNMSRGLYNTGIARDIR